MNEIKENII